MSEKRPAEGSSEAPVKKRRFNGSSAASKRRTHGVDENSGQHYAFGSLDAATVPTDEDLEWEDETDALAYLKSVRQQAGAIPHVIIAQRAGTELPDGAIDRSIYSDGKGDFRGYYQDGAYTAYPEGFGEDEDEADSDEPSATGLEEGEDDDGYAYSGESSSSGGGPHNSSSVEIHDAYYLSLTSQYQSLRDILRQQPPEDAIAALPSTNPFEVGSFGPSSGTFNTWSHHIRQTDPLPVQIALMHKDSVVRLLRIILIGKFFRKGHELRERTSRWIWALLARLPEQGELDYQEVGWIRELGKRAVLFMISLAEAEVLREQYGVGGSGSSDGGGADVEVDEYVDEEINDSHSDQTDSASEPHPTKTAEEKLPPEEPNSEIEGSNNTTHAKESLDHEEEEKPQAAQQAATSPSDVAMEIASDDEEGEVSTKPQARKEAAADVEAAKARLLAQLDEPDEQSSVLPDKTHRERSMPESTASGEHPAAEEDDEKAREVANMRATLNMILTVAGEFYGQRDLLEFRNPFSRITE